MGILAPSICSALRLLQLPAKSAGAFSSFILLSLSLFSVFFYICSICILGTPYYTSSLSSTFKPLHIHKTSIRIPMDKLRHDKVLKFEEFIERRLKPDLVRAIAGRYGVVLPCVCLMGLELSSLSRPPFTLISKISPVFLV